jgi:hypothetical protein
MHLWPRVRVDVEHLSKEVFGIFGDARPVPFVKYELALFDHAKELFAIYVKESK